MRRSKDKKINEEGKEMIEWLGQTGMGIANGTVTDKSEGDY